MMEGGREEEGTVGRVKSREGRLVRKRGKEEVQEKVREGKKGRVTKGVGRMK